MVNNNSNNAQESPYEFGPDNVSVSQLPVWRPDNDGQKVYVTIGDDNNATALCALRNPQINERILVHYLHVCFDA